MACRSCAKLPAPKDPISTDGNATGNASRGALHESGGFRLSPDVGGFRPVVAQATRDSSASSKVVEAVVAASRQGLVRRAKTIQDAALSMTPHSQDLAVWRSAVGPVGEGSHHFSPNGHARKANLPVAEEMASAAAAAAAARNLPMDASPEAG